MTVLFTENRRLSNVIKQELWPDTAYCRAVVVANEAAAKSYVPGTVLGKVTATGKYKIAVQSAVDGSQTPAAIVHSEYTVAATTDTSVLVFVKGPLVVSKFGLLLDASFGTAPQIAAAYASLELLGIACNDAI